MEDFVREAIDYGLGLGGRFVEVRVLDDIWNFVYVDDLRTGEVTTRRKRGAGIRVFLRGNCAFTATSNLTRAGLRQAVKSAYSAAKAFRRAKGAELDFTQIPVVAKAKTPRRMDFRDVSDEEKVKRVLELGKRVKEVDDKIVVMKYNYDEALRSMTVGNSLGTLVTQDSSYGQVWVSVIAKEGDRLAVRRTRFGKRGGFEILFSEEIEEIPKISETAVQLLKAKPVKGGKYTMLFDPQMVGIFAHEAIGHPTEGDSMIFGGSVLAGAIGEKVGGDNVTLIDDPTLPWNTFYYYDDEGTPSRRTVIIDKGVFVTPLHSIESARIMQVPPNGHGRVAHFGDRPRANMTTTIIQPDPNGPEPEEMLKELKNGVYAVGEFHGFSGNITGSFQFRCQEAWIVEKGEKKELRLGATISGMSLKAIKDITHVGRDFGTPSSGHFPFDGGTRCDGGGPHLIIKDLVIGGES